MAEKSITLRSIVNSWYCNQPTVFKNGEPQPAKKPVICLVNPKPKTDKK